MRPPLALALLLAATFTHAWAAPAGDSHPPVVVETFTSKFCPNCPAGEATLNGKAEGRGDFMVVLEHVDYWDDAANGRVDPLGNPDITQRQYDYSNRLGRRPGEVFTPQPILDGAAMASPPLWLGWDGVLQKALDTNFKAQLAVKPLADGGVAVSLPKDAPTKGMVLVLMGVEKSPERPNLWQALSLNSVDVTGNEARLGKAQVPAKGSHVLVLLQESGGGVVKGMGLAQR